MICDKCNFRCRKKKYMDKHKKIFHFAKEDIIYNNNLKPYLDLKKKIKKIKKLKNNILIKINYHECSGATTFIDIHNGKYNDFNLIDNKKENSSILLNQKTNSILFGYPENDIDTNENIIYIYVLSKLDNLYRNIVNCQLQTLNDWNFKKNIEILNKRNDFFSYLIKNNILVNPFFYSFKDALDYCIDIFNE